MNATNSYEELNAAIADNNWVLLYFSASWCGPCGAYSPVVESVAKDYGKIVETLKVDVEEIPESAGELSIRAVPTLVLLNKQKTVDSLVGAQTQSQVMKWLSTKLLTH